MPFDGLAVRAICNELAETFINARIMKVYQPHRHTIVLHLRLPGATTKLVLSADPVYPRIHTTSDELTNPLNPPAFCMLLRKHLEPSRILSIQQKGYERLIEIMVEAHDEHQGHTKKTLVFELMGRHSNLMLVDARGMILDAIHRVSEEQSQVRVVTPGILYTEPPDQGKVDPTTVTNEQFLTNLRLLPANTPLFKGLLDDYQGLSPAAAKEVIARAGLNPELAKVETGPTDWAGIWDEFSSLVASDPVPTLVDNKQMRDFFAYELTSVPGQQRFHNLNSLLEAFYAKRIETDKMEQHIKQMNKVLKTHLKRLARKENIQQQTLKEADKAGTWQKRGELLTANLYQVERGRTEVTVVDYYDENQPEITISLDPQLSPSENAQRYFKKYTKLKNSQTVTKRQLRKTQRERRYIEEVQVHMELADSLDTLLEIKEELTKSGYLKQKASRNEHHRQSRHHAYLSDDGIEILVGRNNRQNDHITFQVARPDDLWFHAQKIPGSHVIVRSREEVPERTLEQAALLAAYFSKARTSPKVPVDYTQRKHVHKPAGAKPGYVIYDEFSTILANPAEENLPDKKRT